MSIDQGNMYFTVNQDVFQELKKLRKEFNKLYEKWDRLDNNPESSEYKELESKLLSNIEIRKDLARRL